MSSRLISDLGGHIGAAELSQGSAALGRLGQNQQAGGSSVVTDVKS